MRPKGIDLLKMILRDFFRSRGILISMLLILVAGVLVLLSLILLPAKVVFPSNDQLDIVAMTDAGNQGSSVINDWEVSDSVLLVSYELRPGFVDPYIAITFTPQSGTLDLSWYNQVVINMTASNTENFGFDLHSKVYLEQKELVAIFFANVLELNPGAQDYMISFDKLKIPDYWYANQNLPSDEKLDYDLSQVISFNLGTAYGTEFGVPRSFQVNSIRFDRDNSSLIWRMVMCYVVIVFCLLLSYVLRYFWRNYKIQISIAYTPVEVNMPPPENNEERILDHINRSFSDPDLTLDKVVDELKVPKRLVSRTIHDKFSCNFKSYLNQLRIHEAKRLITETDLGMGEIAFKVGFNTQSHFNRVFKSIEGHSPSEAKYALS